VVKEKRLPRKQALGRLDEPALASLVRAGANAKMTTHRDHGARFGCQRFAGRQGDPCSRIAGLMHEFNLHDSDSRVTTEGLREVLD
jgi:hypothetical protein